MFAVYDFYYIKYLVLNRLILVCRSLTRDFSLKSLTNKLSRKTIYLPLFTLSPNIIFFIAVVITPPAIAEVAPSCGQVLSDLPIAKSESSNSSEQYSSPTI